MVGEAKVEEILEDSPDNIWKETKSYSGIDLKYELKNTDIIRSIEFQNNLGQFY